MIGISKLYCGAVEASDPLRYGRRSGELPSHLLQFSADKKPVVVWNVTRRCNLKCVHCYSHSEDKSYGGELSLDEGKALIEDLSQFGSPVILFSGGEPLIRPDILELIQVAVRLGRRAVVSTNGTLITERMAAKLQEIGLSYVGISLDGLEKVHDAFRGFEGTFQRVMTAIKNCQDVGLRLVSGSLLIKGTTRTSREFLTWLKKKTFRGFVSTISFMQAAVRNLSVRIWSTCKPEKSLISLWTVPKCSTIKDFQWKF